MSDISDLALTAIESLGGHAPAWKIAEHVAAHMSEDDYHDATRAGFIAIVRNALRASSNGLPAAVSVSGQYVQTDLLTLDEFHVVVAAYLKRSNANLNVAEKFDALCLIKHGVSVLHPGIEEVAS